MIASGLQNPFVENTAEGLVTMPPWDVPELHADVMARVAELLSQIRQAGRGAGLLFLGEKGAGKSHLLARLRQQMVVDPKAHLTIVRMFKAYPGRLWRHLREHLVDDLLRTYPGSSCTENGLLRILRNRFPEWAAAAQGASRGGLVDWLFGRARQADLTPHLNKFAQSCPVDYTLRQVLPLVANPDLTTLAHDCLRGKQLGTADLQRLGLPPVFPSEIEQESLAHEFVLSVLRLAGDKTFLMLCFDQIEAIASGSHDLPAFRQFTSMATALVAETGPRLVITSIRPHTLLDVRKADVGSDVEKISQATTGIPSLTWEQTVRITVARLEAEPGCREARRLHPNDPYWPLHREFLETLFQKRKRYLTPRELIMACREEFERLKKVQPAPEGGVDDVTDSTVPSRTSQSEQATTSSPLIPPSTPNSSRRSVDFASAWEALRRQHLEKIQGVQFDTVMAISLPWLIHLAELPLIRVQEIDRRIGNVNLVFQPEIHGKRPLGVSFCNQAPRQLWYRLDQLLAQWQNAREGVLGTLVALRRVGEHTTDAGNERLKKLEQAGVRVIMVETQQLGELAAFQGLLTRALTGNLHLRSGELIGEAEYTTWAKDHLSESVKEFFHQIFEPYFTPPTPAAHAPRPGPAPKAAPARKKAASSNP